MKSLYLDNAATSFPKAPDVAQSIANYLTNIGCNANRGAYAASFEVEDKVYETRELICELMNFKQPEHVIFTKNITESLNVLIKGLLKEDDHVIISSMEHNAVMRPLNALSKQNVTYSKIPCNEQGELNAADIAKEIRPNTKAVIMTHASNVCGTILDLKEVGKVCREHSLFFIIDSAQTLGFSHIDFEELNADAIGFTGHKGLLGPQGIGGFVVNDRMVNAMSTLIEGGTGSLSDTEVQPDYMPDRFEAGTLNIPGIYGLNAALKYILNTKIDAIREKELIILDGFLQAIYNISDIKPLGKDTIDGRTALVSIDFKKHDNGEISHLLCKEYGIMTRCGLHCAPSAHQTLDTLPNGTVRFSFSHFNTIGDVEYVVDSIYKCMKWFIH